MKNNRIRDAIFAILLFSASQAAFCQDKPDALKLYHDGRYDEAVKVCLDELKETPKNMDSYAVLCWSLLKQKNYKDAATYAEKGLKVSRYDRRVIDSAAQAYYYLGDNQKALSFFEEFAMIAPTTDDIKMIYYFMGEIFIRLAEFNNADIAFSTALHYDNKQAAWWARLGYAREMAKDFKFASEAYENALKLDPGLSEALRGIESTKKVLGQ
jgi:tetratricopeptide (TPR) repeat protein